MRGKPNLNLKCYVALSFSFTNQFHFLKLENILCRVESLLSPLTIYNSMAIKVFRLKHYEHKVLSIKFVMP